MTDPQHRYTQLRAEDFSALAGLDTRISHVEGQIGQISQQVAGMSATVASFGRMLEDMSDKVHAPTRTQWGPILTAVGTVFVFFTTYIMLTTRPLEAAVSSLVTNQNGMWQLLMERSNTIGRFEADLEGVKKAQDRNVVELEGLEHKAADMTFELGKIQGRREILLESE